MTLKRVNEDDSNAPFTERSKVRLTFPSFFALLATVCMGFGAWVSLRADVAQQSKETLSSRYDMQRQVDDAKKQVEDLRAETRASLARVYEEQRKSSELLVRVDENVKILTHR